MIEILETFYLNPRFRIKDRDGKSEWRKQKTGIGKQNDRLLHTDLYSSTATLPLL